MLKSQLFVCKTCNREFVGYSKRTDPNYKRLHCSNDCKRNDPEYVKKLSDAAKNQWNNNELARKMSDSQKIAQNRVETKKMKSDIMSFVKKESWKDPEFAKKMTNSWKRKPNNLERSFTKWLNENHPGEWKYVGDGSIWFDRCNPDFININGKKQVIEIYGCYWHCCSKCGFGETILPNGLTANQVNEIDENKKETYSKYGFDMLCFWEHEIKYEGISPLS